MKYFLKVFFSCLIAFSLMIGGGFYFYLNYEDGQKQETVKFDQLEQREVMDRVNILLLGVDSLDGSQKSRTDTMMLLSMDPKTKSGFILSIPRDSIVPIKGVSDGERINHAHAYGGVELSLETVKSLLNIPIHHYVKVDYNALFKTVDDVGGVEVDVPMDMNYEDLYAKPPLKIHLKKGVQTLNGEKSMELLRFRKGYALQDIDRIKTQQSFMDALIRKLLSPASITKIPQYLDTMSTYVDTDMSKKELLGIAKDAIQISPSNIEKATLTGRISENVYVPNAEEIPKQMEYLMSSKYEKPAEGSENNATNGSSTSVETAIKIAVYNGSGYSNIARRAVDLLKIEDVIVTGTGNASSFDNVETHIYYKSDKELAKKIKKTLGVGRIYKGTSGVDYNEPDIAIILGKDFKSE